MNHRPKRVLVTGAAGYLGRHVCKVLGQLPDVHVVANVRRADNDPIVGAECLLELDLEHTETEDWCKVLDQIDVAIWLAGADARQCADDPVKAVRVNVQPVIKFAQASSKCAVQRIVFASTFHVYGPTRSTVISEDTLPTPIHPYPASKLAAEYFLNTTSVQTVAVRLSNAVGKPIGCSDQAWKLVANSMCRQAVDSKQITVTAPGQHRDFLSISDAARALVHLTDIRTNSLHCVVNVGGGRCLSMLELAGIISSQCGACLGFIPEVNVLSQGERNDKFQFKIDRLLDSGFRFSHSIEDEICECLKHCATLQAAAVEK